MTFHDNRVEDPARIERALETLRVRAARFHEKVWLPLTKQIQEVGPFDYALPGRIEDHETADMVEARLLTERVYYNHVEPSNIGGQPSYWLGAHSDHDGPLRNLDFGRQYFRAQLQQTRVRERMWRFDRLLALSLRLKMAALRAARSEQTPTGAWLFKLNGRHYLFLSGASWMWHGLTPVEEISND